MGRQIRFLMALTRMLITIAIIAIGLSPALATDYLVGDQKGWTLQFDYKGWAADKQFHVGDKLKFVYPKGAHNVITVDQNAFDKCIIPTTGEKLTSGNDVISLDTPGKKWYICGVGKHCELGNQKIEINVLPGSGASAGGGGPTHSPTPSPSGGDHHPPKPSTSSPSDGDAPSSSSTPSSAAAIGITNAAKFYALMIATLGLLMIAYLKVHHNL